MDWSSIPGLMIGIAAFVTITQAATLVNNAYDAQAYLKRFNYMDRDNMETGDMKNEDDYTEAIKMFQHMANITVTGTFDDDTKTMMNMPRCGMPDNMGYSNNARRKRFDAVTRWPQSDLTWRLNTATNDLSRNEIRRIMAEALKVWSDVSTLTFQESSADNADFLIDFAESEHGDGNPFDGPNGVLAHAYFPTTNPIGGDAHFDDAEQYTDQTNQGINLFQVAAHEFGHSLGLGHSEFPEALMAAFYRGYVPNFELHPDDVAGIRSLYGENTGRPEMTMRPFTNPPSVTDNDDGNPAPVCPENIDAFTTTADGRTFAFTGNLVYQIETTGVVAGFPQPISQVFAGLPNDLDAGFMYQNGRNYFFKGDQYWAFSSTTAIDGYPRPISQWGLPADIDSAFVWSGNGRIYFTKGDQYYRFNTRYGRIDSGYPRPLSVWGLPTDHVDAAQQWDNGRTYFYVDDVYYRFNDEDFGPDETYPRPTAYWWFGCGTAELQAGPSMDPAMDPNGAMAVAGPSILALVLSTLVAFFNSQ